MLYTFDREQWLAAAAIGADVYGKAELAPMELDLPCAPDLVEKIFVLRMLVHDASLLDRKAVARRWGIALEQLEAISTTCRFFITAGKPAWAWKMIRVTLMTLPTQPSTMH